MKKYYAIKHGNKTGIVTSWEECSESVKGYKGAEYKGFNSEEEALNYLKGDTEQSINPNKTNIFVNSSFKDSKASFGILIENKGKEFKFFGVFSSISTIESELMTALIGIELACDMGFSDINLIYKYEGIENFANGSWRAKGDAPATYVKTLNMLCNKYKLDISFKRGTNPMTTTLIKRSKEFICEVDKDKILQDKITVNDIGFYK